MQTHPDTDTEPPQATKFQAEFWRSPFAVTTAIVVTAQAMMLLYGALTGKNMNFIMTMPVILIATMMLTAGIWPNWNYLSLTRRGVEQHAGLTAVKLDWNKIQNVQPFKNWVEIRYVNKAVPDTKQVKTVRLLNRYDLSPAEFGNLIDERWRMARGLDF